MKYKLTLGIALASFACQIAFGQGPNLALNPSFETADPANPGLASNWQVRGKPYTRVPISDAWDGHFAIQLLSGQGAEQDITLNQTVPYPVRITVLIRTEGIPDNETDKVGASLDCQLTYIDRMKGFCPLTLETKFDGTIAEWTLAGYNTKNLESSTLGLQAIQVRLVNGASAGTAWFDEVEVREFVPATAGLASVRFDDSLLSTFKKGWPMLRSYGFVGSEAVITSYMQPETGGDGIHMTWANLAELRDNKWSTLSHTVTHRDLSQLGIQELNDELYESQKELVDKGFPVWHIAEPFGGYDQLVLARIQAERYNGYRYLSATSSDGGLNPQGLYPYNVIVHEIVSTTSVAEVQAWLKAARETQSWLVFLVHEIDTPNGIYTVTSARFAEILQAVRDSAIPVVSYDEGFLRMSGQIAPARSPIGSTDSAIPTASASNPSSKTVACKNEICTITTCTNGACTVTTVFSPPHHH